MSASQALWHCIELSVHLRAKTFLHWRPLPLMKQRDFLSSYHKRYSRKDACLEFVFQLQSIDGLVKASCAGFMDLLKSDISEKLPKVLGYISEDGKSPSMLLHNLPS